MILLSIILKWFALFQGDTDLVIPVEVVTAESEVNLEDILGLADEDHKAILEQQRIHFDTTRRDAKDDNDYVISYDDDDVTTKTEKKGIFSTFWNVPCVLHFIQQILLFSDSTRPILQCYDRKNDLISFHSYVSIILVDKFHLNLLIFVINIYFVKRLKM